MWHQIWVLAVQLPPIHQIRDPLPNGSSQLQMLEKCGIHVEEDVMSISHCIGNILEETARTVATEA